MRKILYSLLFVPALLVSCEKEMHDGLVVMYDDTYAVSSEGGSATFRIDTDASWRIEFDEFLYGELEISRMSGKGNAEISVTVSDANEVPAPKRFMLMVVSGKNVQPVSILQAAAPLVFELSTQAIAADWEERTYPVSVTTNAEGIWFVNKDDHGDMWYDIVDEDKDNGTFGIEVREAESTTESRSAKVIVDVWHNNDYVEKEIVITQSPKP